MYSNFMLILFSMTFMFSLAYSKSNIGKQIIACNTDKFQVRITEKESGVYTYSSWTKKQNVSEKPDLVIMNGTWSPDGSGGNGQYNFPNKGFNYKIIDGTGVCAEYCGFHLEISRSKKKVLDTKCVPLKTN